MAPKAKKSSKSRGFTFTLFDFEEEVPAPIKELFDEAEYVFAGKEICPTTGKAHIQGSLYFPCQRHWNAVVKRFPQGTHVECAKAHVLQNQDYCTKDEDIWFRKGKFVQQGSRNDITDMKDIIAKSGTMAAVVDGTQSYQAWRSGEFYLKYKEVKRSWKTEVRWFTDEEEALSFLSDEYCTVRGKFWNAYDAHEDVLLYEPDIESDPSFYKLLFGRIPFSIDTKGGSRQMLAKRIAVYHSRPAASIGLKFDGDELHSINHAVRDVMSRVN